MGCDRVLRFLSVLSRSVGSLDASIRANNRQSPPRQSCRADSGPKLERALLGALLSGGRKKTAAAKLVVPLAALLLPPQMICAQTPTVPISQFFAFASNGTQGYSATAPLLQASDDNFYGTTQFGGDDGAGCTAHSCYGTVFKLTPGGQFTLLHTFAYGDSSAPYSGGEKPTGGLVEGPDGYLYGVTSAGGTLGRGTIYKINKAGDFTTLYQFLTFPARSPPWGHWLSAAMAHCMVF